MITGIEDSSWRSAPVMGVKIPGIVRIIAVIKTPSENIRLYFIVFVALLDNTTGEADSRDHPIKVRFLRFQLLHQCLIVTWRFPHLLLPAQVHHLLLHRQWQMREYLKAGMQKGSGLHKFSIVGNVKESKACSNGRIRSRSYIMKYTIYPNPYCRRIPSLGQVACPDAREHTKLLIH